uniref:Uncharacterized protein n=1 Tax=Anopheles dirus TaxID=7168 RepID=A0A182NYT3_9DIPT
GGSVTFQVGVDPVGYHVVFTSGVVQFCPGSVTFQIGVEPVGLNVEFASEVVQF